MEYASGHSARAMNPHLPTGNFYGEMLRQHLANGFSLSETRYFPGTRLPPHSHESPYFGFVLSGSYTESYGQRVRRCQPAMIVCHPAGELHAQDFSQAPVNLFRIELDCDRLDLNQTALNLDCGEVRGGLPVSLAGKLYQEFCEPDELSHLAITGLGFELIATIARLRKTSRASAIQPPPWLSQAQELLKSRYLEHFTFTEIAAEVGVHPVTLAREFRRHYKCTMGEMLRRERIEFACRLLKSGESLSSIAISAGFYDQSHFARAFKRLLGMTPTSYRANFRPR